MAWHKILTKCILDRNKKRRESEDAEGVVHAITSSLIQKLYNADIVAPRMFLTGVHLTMIGETPASLRLDFSKDSIVWETKEYIIPYSVVMRGEDAIVEYMRIYK